MPGNLALKVTDLDVHYQDFQALWNISLKVVEKEILSIIGSNGSGKSTLLSTIVGLLKPSNGSIEFFGNKIEGLPPHETVNKGISLVPEGRRIFPRLTVYENLFIGSYPSRCRDSRDEAMDKIFDLFPVIKDRRDQMGSTLSGGEQQMLAIGRAMMSMPKLILCDEISLGLAPLVIKDIYRRLVEINSEGITIILVEQDITRSLKVANIAYIILKGKIVLKGEPSSFGEDQVKKAYFGI